MGITNKQKKLKQARCHIKWIKSAYGLKDYNFYLNTVYNTNRIYANTIVITKENCKNFSAERTIELLEQAKLGQIKVEFDNTVFENLEEFRRYMIIMELSGVPI